MPIFTMLIDEQPVMAFVEADLSDACAFAARPALQRELAHVFRSRWPHWDPEVPVSVRISSADEYTFWRNAFETRAAGGEIFPFEKHFAVMLVGARPPT